MILGLDMSTKKTGFCIMDYNKNIIKSGVIEPQEKDVFERINILYYNFKEILTNYDIKHIVLEDVPVSKHNNLKTGKILCVLQGIILSLCFENNIGFTLYNPSAWRSVIGTYDGTREGLKRENQKKKAIEIVNNLYNLDFKYYIRDTKENKSNDDEAESICISLAYLKELNIDGL